MISGSQALGWLGTAGECAVGVVTDVLALVGDGATTELPIGTLLCARANRAIQPVGTGAYRGVITRSVQLARRQTTGILLAPQTVLTRPVGHTLAVGPQLPVEGFRTDPF